MSYGHSGSLPGTLTTTRWASPGFAFAVSINTGFDTDGLNFEEPTVLPDHDLFESVGIFGERLGAALAESWIPVVANGSGAGGSLWRSDGTVGIRILRHRSADLVTQDSSLAA